MIELLLLWGYMFLVNASVGIGVIKLYRRIFGRWAGTVRVEVVPAVMTGVVAISAYVSVFSIFYRIGAAAHLLLLALAVLSARAGKEIWSDWFGRMKQEENRWIFLLYGCLAAGTAFFASRGLQHTDTGIYHAQAIRWYEEYGLVKGLGNLQLHFAYNSAYLGYAAAFSMKWLLGRSLHGTNGFLQAVLCIWAVNGLRGFKRRKNNLTDAMRAGVLIYALVNAEYIMSPATDFGTMYLILYVIVRWAELAGGEKEGAGVDDYALLCVSAVSAATFKLSAGLLVLLTCYPAWVLIRGKDRKRILVYLISGIAVLAPYLIRNVLISGWLLYPFPALDLFQVDWKIPTSYVEIDSAQIKVWGRCLFDVSLIDLPVRQWAPVWWGARDTYEKMLIEANLAAAAVDALSVFRGLMRRKRICPEKAVLHLSVLAGILAWFFLAPFIRYGLAFLLAYPLLAVGEWLRPMRLDPVRIAAGFGSVAVCGALCYYLSYYFLYDVNWTKAHLGDPAYLLQQSYDSVETDTLDMGGLSVFYPVEGDNISYHAFPATAYRFMAERSTLRGDSLADGFAPR